MGFFDLIYQIMGVPLGWGMWLFYKLVNSYGIALLLFTLFIRLAMFPLSLKQQKSTVKMQLLKPQMDELQAKYKNNREKLGEEMDKLYKKEGYNPFSGCLPLLIQMPILFGFIEVVYRPLKHILRLSADVIKIGEQIALDQGLVKSLNGLNSAQIFVIQGVQSGQGAYNAMGEAALSAIRDFRLNFLGMNLGDVPKLSMFGDILNGVWNPIILVPILSGLSALIVSFISMRTTPQSDVAGANASMKSMMFMMPVLSTMIAFSVPAGVGLYWFYSNLASMAQTLILNKFYNPKEMAEKAKTEFEARREQERLERIEAKKLARERGEEMKEKALSQKEINRRKLAEARRRDAERYGEDYVEVTDDDLK